MLCFRQKLISINIVVLTLISLGLTGCGDSSNLPSADPSVVAPNPVATPDESSTKNTNPAQNEKPRKIYPVEYPEALPFEKPSSKKYPAEVPVDVPDINVPQGGNQSSKRDYPVDLPLEAPPIKGQIPAYTDPQVDGAISSDRPMLADPKSPRTKQNDDYPMFANPKYPKKLDNHNKVFLPSIGGRGGQEFEVVSCEDDQVIHEFKVNTAQNDPLGLSFRCLNVDVQANKTDGVGGKAAGVEHVIGNMQNSEQSEYQKVPAGKAIKAFGVYVCNDSYSTTVICGIKFFGENLSKNEQDPINFIWSSQMLGKKHIEIKVGGEGAPVRVFDLDDIFWMRMVNEVGLENRKDFLIEEGKMAAYIRCPENHVLVGFKGRSGSAIDQLTGVCAPLDF